MAGKLMQIKMERTGLAAIPPSVRREVFRIAIGRAGEFWWYAYLPIHFTNQAYARYSFVRRQDGYERGKRKRHANGQGRRAIGEVKPNVWSGESRERSLRQKNVVSRAASHSRYYCLVILNAPALNYKNPASNVNPRAEVIRLIDSERARMQGVFQTHAIKLFVARGYNHRIVKVIRAA